MRIFMIFLSVVLIYGCATPQPSQYFAPPSDYVPLNQIQIKPQFDVISLTKENLMAEQQRCVPLLQPNASRSRAALNEFPRNDATTSVGHRSSSKQFIYHGTTGICMEYSANKYPIYAAETFIGTANPTGVPPDVTTDWYKKIALQIALKGQANVVYVTDKRTALLVSYWSEPTGGCTLRYSSEFKKVGEWENVKVDYTFTHPSLTGFSETKRGSSMEKAKRFPLSTGP